MQLGLADKKRTALIFTLLLLAGVVYMTYNNRGNWGFILPLRGKRLAAFVVVGFSSVIGTFVFQTITQNRILSPSIVGMDSLYMLFQTISLFFLGSSHILFNNARLNFFVSTLLMVSGSYALYWLFFKKYPGRLFLLLMTGMVLSTLFRNLSTFLQVMMDPNEFDQIYQASNASFNNINSDLLVLSYFIIAIVVVWLLKHAGQMNVLHLGRQRAIALGIEVDKISLRLFAAISILTAVSTALIGPVSFLGFLGASISYRLFRGFHHDLLFLGGGMLTTLMIIGGQLVVEHLFLFNITLGVVIEFGGGAYYLYILLKERRKLL